VETGLDATFQILTRTPNRAALPWLIAAVDSPSVDLRVRAVTALLQRRDSTGLRELLRRWDRLDVEQVQAVVDHAIHMTEPLREGLASRDAKMITNVCSAVVRLRDYDLIPQFVKVGEEPGNPHAEAAAHTALALAEALSEDLRLPRDYSDRRDPTMIRQYVFGSLKHAAMHFAQHRRDELIEAYLLLVGKDDSFLRQILDSPHEPIYASVVRHLTFSPRPGVIRVILDLLEEALAPDAVLHVVARRRDAPFLQLLLGQRVKKPTPNLQANLKRVETWPWLTDDPGTLGALSDSELSGAVQLVMCSNVSRQRAFHVVQFALEHGGDESRRAAASALAEFRGSQANELVLVAVEDPDPEVQAHAARQLRERGIPGAIHRLTEMLDSPHMSVRTAVQQSLGEFTFTSFLAAWEKMDEEKRAAAGPLIRRVDPKAIDQLRMELTCMSRARRLRGLELAVVMQAATDVEPEILVLSTDSDHFVRAAAANALVHIHTPQSQERLREMKLDRATSVQQAAEFALERIITIPDPFAENTSGPAPFVLPEP
jgi:HEAT repeat protein